MNDHLEAAARLVVGHEDKRLPRILKPDGWTRPKGSGGNRGNGGVAGAKLEFHAELGTDHSGRIHYDARTPDRFCGERAVVAEVGLYVGKVFPD
jgi:hypothetical protein